jgi:predicted nucleic acid-binding protein
MRLVVDTNVFVSAALKENSLPFLVVRWIDRHDGLLKSAVTEQQLLEVLRRPYIVAARRRSSRCRKIGPKGLRLDLTETPGRNIKMIDGGNNANNCPHRLDTNTDIL